MSNYPGAFDTDANLYIAANLKGTALNSIASPSDTTLMVVSTVGFPTGGILRLGTPGFNPIEFVSYTGTTGGSFTGVTRGIDPDFPALSHIVTESVTLSVAAQHHNALKGAAVAIENTLGVNPQGSAATVSARIATIEASVDSTIVRLAATQTLTNKTIDSTTNTVRASKLATAGAPVVLTAGAAPTAAGQALISTSATAAGWAALNTDPAFFNVKNYGAVGDGVADDTTAINNTITAASAVNGVVFFPPGSYNTTGGHTVPARTSVQGASRSSVIITMTGVSATQSLFLISSRMSMSDLTLVRQSGVSTDQTGYGLHVVGAVFNVFKNIAIQGFQYGIYSYQTAYLHFEDVNINTCVYGFYMFDYPTPPIAFWSNGNNSWFHNVHTYINCQVSGRGITDMSTGFYLQTMASNFINCAAQNIENGFVVTGPGPADVSYPNDFTRGNTFTECYMEDVKKFWTFTRSYDNVINGGYYARASGTTKSDYIYSLTNAGVKFLGRQYNNDTDFIGLVTKIFILSNAAVFGFDRSQIYVTANTFDLYTTLDATSIFIPLDGTSDRIVFSDSRNGSFSILPSTTKTLSNIISPNPQTSGIFKLYVAGIDGVTPYAAEYVGYAFDNATNALNAASGGTIPASLVVALSGANLTIQNTSPTVTARVSVVIDYLSASGTQAAAARWT